MESRPDLQLLAKYAALLPDSARTVVEIGTHLGETAIILANHSPKHVHVYTIDTGERWLWERPDSHMRDYIDSLYLRFFENPNIHFMLGSSHYKEGDYVVPWGLGEIDLLFIDGDHNYDAVMSDLLHWAPMVKPNGYMLLHDDVLGELDKVYGALRDYLCVHEEWEILEAVSTMIACQKTACQKRKDDTANDSAQ